MRWYQNGLEIKGRSTFVIKIEEAEVRSAGNYSCIPFNKVGMAEAEAQVGDDGRGREDRGFVPALVEVHAAPEFVERLPVYSGKLTSGK